jgi:hypothetical protein
MERVIKRFLLHNNRENEDIRESDFDELKQDVQMIRFEMLSNLKQNKDYVLRYMSVIQNGVSVIGDYLLQTSPHSVELAINLKNYQRYEHDLAERIEQLHQSACVTNKQLANLEKKISVGIFEAAEQLLHINFKKGSLSNSVDEVFRSTGEAVSYTESPNVIVEEEDAQSRKDGHNNKFLFVNLNEIQKVIDEE